MLSVLIIAPDHELRRKVRTILTSPQLNVRDSITAPEAVRILQNEKTNLIIVQEKPGAMTLEDFIRGIKKVSREQSFLVLLENHSMQRALELMKMGVYDCMEPHFDSLALIGVVNKAMGKFDSRVPDFTQEKFFWWKSIWAWSAIVSILIFVSAFFFYWKPHQAKEKMKREKEIFLMEMEFTLPYPHPSGISFDGENIWICDWFTQSVYRHKQSANFEILSVHHFADLNPVGMAWSGSIIWVVSADGKIQKHALDEKLTVLNSAKAPDSAPSGIAHDGNYIWTVGSNSKKVFKHLPDEKLTVLAEFLYPGDQPVGLFWDGSNLWSVDGVRKALLRHRVDGNRLLIDEVQQLHQYRDPDFKLVSATFDGKRFWSLSESPSRVIRHKLE